VRRRLALVAIAFLLASGACQRAPQTHAPAPASVVDPGDAARKAIAAQNWPVAAAHLRTALQQEPDSLFLHYSLAICATWLNRQDEAVREFEWVVAHAAAQSEESTTARRWLADKTRPTQSAAGPALGDPNVGDSGVHGMLIWAEPGQSPAPQSRLQLFLVGLRGTPTKALQYVLRSDRDGHYEFKGIVPGSYKLTDAIAARPKWRLRVALQPGQDLTLDLGPQNGAGVRDDFPEGAPRAAGSTK
jgi:hypothetical protein